jgi:hypothetical protein
MFVRVALALSFLSAVADRFGVWGPGGAPNVTWGNFPAFLDYTALLLGFLPVGWVPFFGWSATLLGLLLSFAISMTISLGMEPAFSYSVWTSAAAALLLACISD